MITDDDPRQEDAGGHHQKTEPFPSLPSTSDTDWQRLADAVNGCFAVIVYLDDGKVRRRIYLSLRAAERAVGRARRKGQGASVVLCQLKPTFILPPDVSTSSGHAG